MEYVNGRDVRDVCEVRCVCKGSVRYVCSRCVHECVCVCGEGGEEAVGLCFPVMYISYSKPCAWGMLNTKQQS